MEATVVDGNGTETGHIIITTIGGRNGQPKQTISYMAERVVGQGSFGIVFQIFHKRTPPEAVDLVSRLLQYSPSLRCTALEACIHPFFNELRDPNTRLPNGRPLPPLFNFKPQELKGASLELLAKLIPEHALNQCPFLGF
ncbi:hypothetical protein L1987_24687 [Smallanthus sonchifolius]|uniref:Uncharacterized protein n=1 Tax=Smallanthus sonchifolius TaxID=185202 RepID=A0ACB9IMH0_9ASTR|nr:hypothetical protein L1987_24687 [Smallanthus sonchifolius]